MMEKLVEPFRAQWEGASERERKLMAIMMVVGALLFVLVPIWLISRSISEQDTESDQMMTVLRDIDRARERLATREAERRAAENRYNQKAPELGTFLEGKTRGENLSLTSVTNQPEQQQGAYRKRLVRGVVQGAELRPVMRLLASIENSPYPIALERVNIDHYGGGDRYNVEIGVLTFDRSAPPRPAGEAAAPNGQAGPPRP